MTTAVEPQAPVAGNAPPAEKKVRAPKEKKPLQAKSKAKAKAASHPPYFQMIKEAVVALNEKSGSSPYAIAKFMEEKHKSVLPANFKKMMALQLKNSVSRGNLVKVKASYKLSDAGKKAKPAADKKKTAKTKTKTAPAAKRETRGATEQQKKKAKVVKKKAVASAKPKQPKSIKSPATKRAKKISA